MRSPLAALVLLLAACGQAVDGPTPAAETSPVKATAQALSVKEETDLYSLDYAWPAEASAIPGLAALLEARLAETRAGLLRDAREAKAAAEAEGYPWRAFGSWTEWKLAGDTPDWLSLWGMASVHTGGAHPMHGYAALLWDKAAGTERPATSLFISSEVLKAAIQAQFCRELDRQRAERRGEPVRAGSTDPFDACLDPVAYPLAPGSSSGKAFDHLLVLVPPYEAGPYAEGGYEVSLAVTPAVIAAVRPEHRAAFAPVR